MEHVYDEVRAALHSIWHRRWLALAVAWGVCIVGWLAVALVPNSYESHGRIFVQLYDPVAAQMGMGNDDRQHDIDRVRDTLTSAMHLAKVIEETRLGRGITTPKQMDGAIQALGRNIRVTSDQDNLFEITATSGAMALSDRENAALARDIVTRMIAIFHSENANSDTGEVTDTMRFLDRQLAQRQQDLAAAEQRRLAFETQHPELAQGGVSLIQQLEQERAEERSLDGDIAAAQSALAVVNGQMAGTAASLGVEGGARGALAQAEAELAKLRARGYTDEHPDVVALHGQIAALRGQAAAEAKNGEAKIGVAGGAPNPAYTALVSERADRQANLQALQARRANIESDIARATAQQNADPDLVIQAQNISRDYDVLKQQYDKLLQDREDLRLKGQVENAHDSVKFQVIDPPTLPRSPVAPNRMLLLALVLVAGIGAGIAAAFLVGEIRGTFATTARLVRVTGLPVLGAISLVSPPALAAMRRARHKRFFAASGALGGVFVLLMALEFVQRAMVA